VEYLPFKRPSDCSILVVDDEKNICELLKSALQTAYKVTTCQSGADAIRLLEARQFDVVISDLGLPGVPGLDVLRFAKDKDDFTEIMIITGFASLESATSAINLGVTAYLTKPLAISDLLLQVEKAVATRLFHLKSARIMKESGGVEPRVKDHLFDMTSLYYFSRKLMLSLELPEILRVVLQEINDRMDASFCVIALSYLNYSEIAAMPRLGEIPAPLIRAAIQSNWDGGFSGFNKELFEKEEMPLTRYKGKKGDFTPPADLKPTTVQLSLMGQNIGSLLIFLRAPEVITEAQSQFLHVFSSFVSGVIEHGYLDLQAKIQARTDGLTGIANHRCFHEQLSREISLADRNKSEFALVMMDIDDFKIINDKYGHLVGDAVIKDLTTRIGAMIRKGDTFSRQGGEEFSLILTGTSFEGAKILAQRVCERVNCAPFVFSQTSVPYTISIGLSIYNGKFPRTKDALVDEADNALYKSKKSGKNRVSTSTHQP
jgi:diguanylate cyclase (GGDEF)-like protein